jgi:general secretion pathway protein G
MKTRKGFTLVEILIVVVILGILAAIVIPQFTNASTEAKDNSLRSNLQSIRAQIQLYKMRNTDVAPAAASFGTLMTQDPNNGGGIGGPFLYAIPNNPYFSGNPANTVAAWGAGGAAWEIDSDGTATGKVGNFRAGDAAHQGVDW